MAWVRQARWPAPRQEFQELFAGPSWEAVMRMGDNVRVDVLAQVESHGDPLWAGLNGIIFGHARNARR